MSSNIERNKALVLDAMTSLFQRRDPLAVERLYTPDYIQHNPGIVQGRAALAELVAQLPEGVFYEPGMVIADGAFVAIHGRIRGWAPSPQVVVDIFRIEDGRLAEHWDVLQEEVAAEGSKSGLKMFAPDEAAAQTAHNRAASESVESLIDYAAKMQANLERVFGERDADRRLLAIRELYADDAVLSEPHGAVTGHEAINAAVTALLSSLPPHLVFTASEPAAGHSGTGRLRWRSGPAGGPVAVTGMDVARFESGLIQTLHVFLDPVGN